MACKEREIGNYIILGTKPIGVGTYGIVYKVMEKSDMSKQAFGTEHEDNVYAIKEIDVSKANQKEKERVERELDFMKKMDEYRHANIISYKQSFKIASKIYIVMEYCERGTLFDYIRNGRSGLPETEFVQLLPQIARGLSYLHAKNIMHRDLKSKNILLTGRGPTAKIADFGVARETTVTVLSTKPGTYLYMSPEVLLGQKYTEKTDIWSLGCTCYEMMTGCYYAEGKTKQEIERSVARDPPTFSQIQYCSEMKELVLRMLDKNQNNRPSANDIQQLLANHICKYTSAQKNMGRPLRTKSESGIKDSGDKREGSSLSEFSSRLSIPESESSWDSGRGTGAGISEALRKRRIKLYKNESKLLQRRITEELDSYTAHDDLVKIRKQFKDNSMDDVVHEAEQVLGRKFFKVEHLIRALKEIEDGIRETQQLRSVDVRSVKSLTSTM